MANFYQILRWLMSITQNLWTIWCGMTPLQHSNTVTSSHCVRFHAKHYTLRHHVNKNTNTKIPTISATDALASPNVIQLIYT